MDKKQLKELIEKEKSKGTSVSLIRDKLVAKGYPKEIIDDVLDLKVPGFSVSKIKLMALWCGIFAIIITIFFVFLNVPITKNVPIIIENKTTVDAGCGNSDPNICLFRKAIENNDKTLCAQIKNEFLNGLCQGDMRTTDCVYYSVAQYPESKMTDCFINQAAEFNNYSLCRAVGKTRDCLDKMFEKNAEKIRCEGDAICVGYLAEKISDYSICSSKDQCYVANSLTFNNPDFCRKIDNNNTRRNCVFFFADASKDIKYCFYNSIPLDTINCVARVYVPNSEITSENKDKLTKVVSDQCVNELDTMDSDKCHVKYALILRMPFMCNALSDPTTVSGCNDLMSGKSEVPLSICETFKNPSAQKGCIAVLEKCNKLDPSARLECLRSP